MRFRINSQGQLLGVGWGVGWGERICRSKFERERMDPPMGAGVGIFQVADALTYGYVYTLPI